MLPEKYLLKDETNVPEGTVVTTCKYCNRKFAVPADEVKLMDNVCESCKDVADKEAAEQAAADMKSDDKTADEKAKALGN